MRINLNTNSLFLQLFYDNTNTSWHVAALPRSKVTSDVTSIDSICYISFSFLLLLLLLLLNRAVQKKKVKSQVKRPKSEDASQSYKWMSGLWRGLLFIAQLQSKSKVINEREKGESDRHFVFCFTPSYEMVTFNGRPYISRLLTTLTN